MTHTYVTCRDCGQPLGELPTRGGIPIYVCACGAQWTLAGGRLAWPYRKRWRHWGSPPWARVILLALLLSWAVFVVVYMVR